MNDYGNRVERKRKARRKERKKKKKKGKMRKMKIKKGIILFIFRNYDSQILFSLLLLYNKNRI
jgi:hypothetical protein